MLGKLLLDALARGPRRMLSPGSGENVPGDKEASAQGVLPLDENNCLVRGRHGWFLANRHDVYLGAALIRYGEYGEIEHQFLCALLSPGDGVIEAGANIGSHTVGLAKALGPEGVLHAIEPQPAVFHALCANLALNALTNVRSHACGCGAGLTTLFVPNIAELATTPHNSGGVSLGEVDEGIPITVRPLDDLVGDMQRLRLIKIDVEGMELEVLKGAQRLIDRHRPLLYVENDRVDNSKALIEHLMRLGYRLWWHAPPLFNPDNYFGIDEDDYPNIVSLNLFCQPREWPVPAYPEGFRLKEVIDSDYHPWQHRRKP